MGVNMEFIKTWTLSICITVLLATVFSLLVPKSSMGKTMKIIIAVFIFVSFILPVARFDLSNINNKSSVKSQSSDTLQDYSEINVELAKKSLKKTILNTLEENEIYNAQVNITATMKDNEITVEKISVSVPSEYNAETVSKIIEEKLGINAEIILNGEEY